MLRQFLSIGAAVVALALPLGCTNTPPSTTSTTPSHAGQGTDGSAVLLVHGLSCPLCANNIDAQLLKVPGVQAVAADLATGRVEVTFDPTHPPTRGALIAAVDESGFTLVNIEGL